MGQNCYFFGTFNPPHRGHISLARAIKAEFNFDKIIFVPAFCPPHKETLDFIHRYNMLKLCVDKDLGEVSDIESRLGCPSYTFQTVNYLLNSKKTDNSCVSSVQIPFIIGYDALIGIKKWKNPEILKEKLEFIVLKRHSGVEKSDIEALSREGFRVKPAKTIDYIDVSSNQIREMVSNKKHITGLVDDKVREYIDDKQLYRI